MCPHLKFDGEFYCGKSFQAGELFLMSYRRSVCDMASRDLWCLDDERFGKCIIYQEGFHTSGKCRTTHI